MVKSKVNMSPSALKHTKRMMLPVIPRLSPTMYRVVTFSEESLPDDVRGETADTSSRALRIHAKMVCNFA